jgi:hypothetical protein
MGHPRSLVWLLQKRIVQVTVLDSQENAENSLAHPPGERSRGVDLEQLFVLLEE